MTTVGVVMMHNVTILPCLSTIRAGYLSTAICLQLIYSLLGNTVTITQITFKHCYMKSSGGSRKL